MYRWACTADRAAIMALWAKSFESYEPYYSWYFDTVYRPGYTLCDFAGASLAAALQLAPYTLRLRGADLKICYLVGVITDPAFRGQGRGHALLREAQKYLRNEGYAAALLYSDTPGFYEPLGFRHCYQQQQLSLPARYFPLLTAANSAEAAWREGDLSDDIPALAGIYEGLTNRYDGYIRRTEENWRNYLGEHHCDKARLLLAEGQAYVLYTVQADSFNVVELGFRDEAALSAALAAAARRAAALGAPMLLWSAPPDAPRRLTPHIPFSCWQSRPFVMARLIGWRAALGAFTYPAAIQSTLTLTIMDDGVEECVKLDIRQGRADVREAPSAAGQTQARLDIASLTQLVFGLEETPPEAAMEPQTRQLLTELFPPLPLWINEYT